MLNQTLLFIDVIRGHIPKVYFTVNGHEHHIGYYLTDSIYRSWSLFMKGVSVSQREKYRFFSAKQSTLRKDVNCAFMLLKKRLSILAISDRS
jgi:hypothetical protein